MTTLRWQIVPELEQLRRQAEIMLEDAIQESGQPQPWKPAVALRDAGDRYHLQVQLPGISAKEVDIEATSDSITLSGERASSEGKLIHSEFRAGRFERRVGLPETILHQQISATYKQGMLTLTMLKLTAAPDYKVRVAIETVSAKGEEALNEPATKTGEAVVAEDQVPSETSDSNTEDLWATDAAA